MARGKTSRFDPEAALRPAIRALPGYQGVEDLETVAAAYGVRAEDVIKLDGNENPYGPAPRALAALRGDYPVHRYPDAEQRKLRAALGRHVGVDPASVVVGAGSDELIEILFRLFVDAGDRILVATPTFGMYDFDGRLHGAEVVDVPRTEDWSLDAEGLLDAAAGARAVFIPSPNNPTGGLLPVALAERLLETGALVVIDEAYIEFAHAESLARRAATEPALAVMRTFSKWGGLAGLRVGYGVMAPAIVDLILRAKQPYNVSIAAEVGALATLEDAAVLDDRACVLAGERERMAKALRALGWVAPWPSEANFLLCRLTRFDGRAVRDALRRRGVFVRYFETPRLRDHIRMSMGTPEQNDRVLEVFAEVERELGAAGG
ncbi:MAG: histidinol-phosphate transaminase [Chloroflexi bacterium]|nr:histidinol-phosphate transaminase [Chloroflexota bacterium]